MATDWLPALIAAPMAGGPSTPQLVAAACAASSPTLRSTGFLAAGYLSPEALTEKIESTRALLAAFGLRSPFGVNVFAPPARDFDVQAVAAYRHCLGPLAEQMGVAPLPEPRWDDDAYEAKLEVLRRARPDFVSFTFGLPEQATVAEFRTLGIRVLLTVTSVEEAQQAAALGPDALVVQGMEAGGHQGSFDLPAEPRSRRAVELVAAVRAVCDLPLVAAGGIAGRNEMLAALDAGADAVAAGTAFMLADEAGTGALLRRAFTERLFPETMVTRAFTGRWARGLANGFAKRSGAPAAYPMVHQVTSPIRKAAFMRGDADHAHLWAGTHWARAEAAPAATIVAAFRGDEAIPGGHPLR